MKEVTTCCKALDRIAYNWAVHKAQYLLVLVDLH